MITFAVETGNDGSHWKPKNIRYSTGFGIAIACIYRHKTARRFKRKSGKLKLKETNCVIAYAMLTHSVQLRYFFQGLYQNLRLR